MSIPLVQNNEKDSINTSIIAIKRNIERINMLLGLSNSEEIDTSEFVKKSDIVDEVTVGNMQSVTSNAVAEALTPVPVSGNFRFKSGYSGATGSGFDFCYQIAKNIIFVEYSFANIRGNNLGTVSTAVIGTCDFRPKAKFTVIGIEYTAYIPIRFAINEIGEVLILESKGLVAGNNNIRGSCYLLI